MSERHEASTYFISYSRADQEFALRLAGDLRTSGVQIWVDQLDIRPSEHWDRAIERAVGDCRGLIVILSPRSAASDNVADEISFAIDHGKSVLPVMIERCRLPLRLARMQVIDATTDYDRALQQCIEATSPGGIAADRTRRRADAAGISDERAIRAAKADLTNILGPIASILVDKEARQARSLADLYTRLEAHIPGAAERERFAAARRTARAPSTQADEVLAKCGPHHPIPANEVDRTASILTHYLGPIASILAKREGSAATSAEEFRRRLAMKIPSERERAEFLHRLADG